MSKPLDDGHRQTLIFAPLWVYTAVAGADGPPEPGQFRQFVEELAASDARLAESADGLAALDFLRMNIDATFAAYQVDSDDPQHGLKRLRGVLKRLPKNEAAAVSGWLVELAIRIGGSRHLAGAPRISEGEERAIRDIASWLGVDTPEFPPEPE